MCEFTVYLVADGKEKQMVAKNIVVAKRKDGKVLLMDAFGEVTPVEGASIEEANTFTQEMHLKA
ncbi:MAG: putative RNA-binding protein [Methanosaeta sp. PtaU1.Bin060]|jgi:predicted RNA-binding protein|nr:MAG: putative RNA-binding protein [Methanosaeta sp. PtaU1.Bin060]